MKQRNIIYARLADLTQDIAGPIPPELIKNWLKTDQSEHAHSKLLEPFRVTGVVVSSDSAGLSKLTAKKTLNEVMKLVSFPKEIIFAYGRMIGGKGIGVWSADNTQMFYPDTVNPEKVLKQMVAAQKELARKSSLQVGMGMHFGEYYEINGGLFGGDADFVEEVAENHTSGGEIVITDSFRQKIDEKLFSYLQKRNDLNFHEDVFCFDMEHIDFYAHKSSEYHYPIPFAYDYFEYLRSSDFDIDANHIIPQKYIRDDSIVILIKVYHERKSLLLNELLDWLTANSLINEIRAKYSIEIVKSNGDLGIFISDDDHKAIDFAEDLALFLKENAFDFSIGLSKGKSFVFPLGSNSNDIAGNPINISSKISEDIDERNTLYIHDSLDFSKRNMSKYEKFEMRKSRINLIGMAWHL